MRHHPFQFRVKHLLILATIVVGLVMVVRLLTPVQSVFWIGGFDLKVTLVGDPGSPIESGVVVLLDNSQHLELFKKYGSVDIGSQEISLDGNRSFDVRTTTCGKDSSDGRELSYHQPQYLGLLLTFQNGSTRRIWAKLPDGRVSQELTIEVAPHSAAP
jgi:hypothetical protein